MRCPFCKTPVARENVHECPRCGLSHTKVARMFGIPPQTLPGITDSTGELSFLQRRAIRNDIARLEYRFPQVRIAIFITGGLDAQTPLNTYTFWLFNNGNVCPNLEKAGLNHTVLLVIDKTNARASLTVGYGLETYLDESLLEAILESSKTDFAEKSTGGAIRTVLHSLSAVLGSVHRQIASVPEMPRHTAAEAHPVERTAVVATY
jgi:uncharacterized membrane protein YgcG